MALDLQSVLIILMISMGLSMAYIIYLARKASNELRRLVVYLLLSMMNGMLVGPLVYLAYPGRITVPGAVELSLALMTGELVPFLAVFMHDILGERQLRQDFFFRAFVITFVLLDELLMSLDFNLAVQHSSYLAFLQLDPLEALFRAISSYWFIFPMALEMFSSVIFIRKSLTVWTGVIFTTQAAIMFLSPTAIVSGFWKVTSIYLSGAVMTGFFVFLFERLYREQSLRNGIARYILVLLGAYTLMMAGIFSWQINGNPIIFSVSIVAEMTLYLFAVLKEGYLTEGRKLYWLADRRWSLLFLLAIFCAEYFMGATFDLQYFGVSSFIDAMGLVPLSRTFPEIISVSVFDFLMAFGTITLSAWFLIMMGVEMGSLVVFKMLKTADPETKTRLLLMLVAYAVYSILLPSFIVSEPSLVPFLGWTMGIGSGGAVAPFLILPMILTYVISGVLSALFGARQLCSTFCTAPVMYQGTFYDSMKKFNGASSMAKSLTTANRTGNLVYRIVSNMVYVAIIAAGIVSYLDSTGYLHFMVYGQDPEFMIYVFLFGFLWYAVFITMPYVGSYGCVNTGYCHWGNFNRFISRFGFFRLKVRSVDQCVTCQTRDCARVCPVGNYGQPGAFIRSGEYRDARCIGIGDCVEACPYDNIFYYDVRHWVRERITRKHIAQSSDQED